MSHLPRVVALLLAAAGALGASLPATASAQDANGFGEKSQLILSVDRLVPLLSYSSQTETSTQNNQTVRTTETGTSAVFLFGGEPNRAVVHTLPRIAFDFVVVRHLTLGGALAAAFGLGGKTETEEGNVTQSRDAPRTTVFGFAPRVGYVLPLGHNFAFWPRGGFAFYSVSAKRTDLNKNNDVTVTASDTLWSLDLDPQFAWVPVEHFFVHFGPILNIPLTGSRSIEFVNGGRSVETKDNLSVFHFGLNASLGGWFDL